MTKKVVFFGDSITDSGRVRTEPDGSMMSYGRGYVFLVASELLSKHPNEYEVFNRGNSGDRIYNLYGRLSSDVWSLNPDILTIFVGINDVEHPYKIRCGTDFKRWEKIYRMIIEETKERLPNIRIILVEPYVVKINEETPQAYKWFSEAIPVYRKLLEQFAVDYGVEVVPLNDKINERANEIGVTNVTKDGTHPHMVGAKIIAEEWLKNFYNK